MKNIPIIIYQTEDGKVKNETMCLNQSQTGELFQKSKSTISEHIKNIFKDEELRQTQAIRNFRTTTKHGAIKGKEAVAYLCSLVICLRNSLRSNSPQQKTSKHSCLINFFVICMIYHNYAIYKINTILQIEKDFMKQLDEYKL